MTESDYIIQHLRMDIDKLKKENEELRETIACCDRDISEDNLRFEVFESRIYNLEEALKAEWNCDEIHYCTRCGAPMPEPAWSDEINEYCDICAGDMGVI